MYSGIEFYRHAFEQEVAANHAMLKMLVSVPEGKQSDALFVRAVAIASHMAQCRKSFLGLLKGDALELQDSPAEVGDLSALELLFTEMETEWRAYLAGCSDSDVDGFFVFTDNGEKWKLSREAQLFQLIGHAAYHRGQVVLLVDLLGGEAFNTDYIDWFTEHHPDGWGLVEDGP